VAKEDGNYRIPLSDYSQFDEWTSAGRDLVTKGTFEYALDERNFELKFEATLWFSRSPPPAALVDSNWRSTSATQIQRSNRGQAVDHSRASTRPG
jgi:hypothetical protein